MLYRVIAESRDPSQSILNHVSRKDSGMAAGKRIFVCCGPPATFLVDQESAPCVSTGKCLRMIRLIFDRLSRRGSSNRRFRLLSQGTTVDLGGVRWDAEHAKRRALRPDRIAAATSNSGQ